MALQIRRPHTAPFRRTVDSEIDLGIRRVTLSNTLTDIITKQYEESGQVEATLETIKKMSVQLLKLIAPGLSDDEIVLTISCSDYLINIVVD